MESQRGHKHYKDGRKSKKINYSTHIFHFSFFLSDDADDDVVDNFHDKYCS